MKKVLIIVAILTLTGCAEKSRFDCPYGKGPSCISMSEIDKNIKANRPTTKISCSKGACNNTDGRKAVQKVVATAATLQTANANPAQRLPETVLQMWICPYAANSGIYYQASFVNIIVKDAVWQAPVLDDLFNRETSSG